MAEKKEQKKIDGRGGARKGAGRKPKHKQLSNYAMSIEKLNSLLPKAIEVLEKGINGSDLKFAKSCAEVVLKKTIADKQTMEISNDPEKPVNIVIHPVKVKK